MTRPDDIPESPEQAATRIAGEFLGAPVSCDLIYKLVYAVILSAQAEATEAAARVCDLIAADMKDVEGLEPDEAFTSKACALEVGRAAKSIRACLPTPPSQKA